MDRPTVTNPDLLQAALKGLQARPKRMNPKWFYDAQGSALFERITTLEAYYPTRVETGILRAEVAALAAHVPAGAALVELGSGASVKTRILLDHLPASGAYVPFDISAEFLRDAAKALRADYPGLAVTPLVGDFLEDPSWPEALAETPKTVFFPGSTIGNLEAGQAVDLMRRVRAWPGVTAFVLGLDMVKDERHLLRAYDDAQGITAAFNLNLLARMNREIGAGFDLDGFAHEARWNAPLARIEMHLVSRRAQRVPVGPTDIPFAEGETIHTESSHKYTRDRLEAMADQAGWVVADVLHDPDRWFGVAVLKP
ncbi:MAG: L-histidine N(alpha)-methyltransferase [Pseudomonadota bacterium]